MNTILEAQINEMFDQNTAICVCLKVIKNYKWYIENVLAVNQTLV